MKRKLIFLINPASGIDNKGQIARVINENIDKTLYEHNVLYTSYPGHGHIIGQQAVKENVDGVVVVGGDGSINEVAKALVNTPVALGIIPLGSGNGLAHFLKIPFNPVKSIETINSFKTIKIDTLSINNHFCISIAGLGFDAKVAQKFARVKIRGFWSYFRIALSEYAGYGEKEYHLTYGGNQIVRNALLINVANSNQYGYKAVISPSSVIDDGLVEICIVKKVPLMLAPFEAYRLFTKTIHRSPFYESISSDEITIVQKEEQIAQIDGEPIDLGKTINIKVIPQSLNVIVN